MADPDEELRVDLDPCLGICYFEPVSKYCFGCTRTLPEIAQWHKKTDDEKYAVLRDRKRRRAVIEANRKAG